MVRVIISAIASSLALLGCATPVTPVSSRLTVFHALPDVAPAGKISVLALRREIEGLEFQAYAEQFTQALRRHGYVVGPLDTDTKYVAFLDYGIDDGQMVARTSVVPQFGVTGSSGSTTTGTINSFGNTTTVNATTTNTPTYGVTGYVPVTRTTREFARFVNVKIYSLTADQKLDATLYEGRVRSEGSCGNLAVLMPGFIAQLTTDFPGKPGGRTEQFALPQGC